MNEPPQQSTSKIPTLCKPSHSVTCTVEDTSYIPIPLFHSRVFLQCAFSVHCPSQCLGLGSNNEGQAQVIYLSHHVTDCHLSSKPNTTHCLLTIISSFTATNSNITATWTVIKKNITAQNNMTLDGQPIGVIIGCVIAFIVILAMLLWFVRHELTCCGGNRDPV